MKQSPGRQNTPRPYWEPKSDTVYSDLAFGLEWLASVWRAEVRCVEDHWSPDLADRADEWASWHEQLEAQIRSHSFELGPMWPMRMRLPAPWPAESATP